MLDVEEREDVDINLGEQIPCDWAWSECREDVSFIGRTSCCGREFFACAGHKALADEWKRLIGSISPVLCAHCKRLSRPGEFHYKWRAI
ncbi:hypothetical protein [Puerhibacterium puerhi]|uniref:hypothetical protein n=1 Tax=Puerhibacterium puerhi TaxID=2692623 RepID=UPI00135BEF79|nr:hypothetical protein [Puerhibacterium puerhi]